MSFTGNKHRILVLYKQMPTPRIQAEDFDVILTPQFYLLKRESLPLRFAYQAKRIAPSIFDGLLEEGSEYAFHVQKEGNDWLFYAYNPEEIASWIQSKGIAPHRVKRLYFAQQLKDLFQKPVPLGEHYVMQTVNDTVTLFPRALASPENLSGTLRMPAKLPGSAVSLHLSGKRGFLTLRQSAVIGSLFLAGALLYFVEAGRYRNSAAERLSEMKANYPKLAGRYTRETILKKYRTIDRRERSKREAIETISKMIFKDAVLQELSIDDKTIEAHFTLGSGAAKEKLRSLAKAAHFEVRVAGNTLLLRRAI